jgi:putative flippase GtrA
MHLKVMLERLVRFGMVGALATGVQYLILVALVRWAGLWPPVASALGFLVSAVGNYLLNYHFTFFSRQPHAPAALKFLILSTVGLALNAALMEHLMDLGWHYLVAQVFVTAIVFLWNFIGNSLWTFRAYSGP